MSASTASTLPAATSPGTVLLRLESTQVTYEAESPVELTASIDTVNNQLQLFYEGTLVASTDEFDVSTSLSSVVMAIVTPPRGYILSGSTEPTGDAPAADWLPIQGGGVMGDFDAPTTIGSSNEWEFTISARPINPSDPTPLPADPVMKVTKIRA